VNPDETGVGEVIVRGDNIMQGYYKNQEATDEILKDGWLYTGDSGWVDKDDHLHIAGRIKNVIVTRAGKNIYPEEVEGEIVQSPYAGEVLVLADVDRSSGDESVKAIIVPDYEYLDEEAKATETEFTDEQIESIIKEEVKTRCMNLADYKRPRTIEIRKEEFPKTSTRKIKRFLLNKQDPPEPSSS
jgi:long-chain acyl-CoA synthetase